MARQKYLNAKSMTGFIAFMNMFVPLSTDLYLPALPEMGAFFSASPALVSMTLTAFFFVFAISIVLFGPLSDKFGRKPILIVGSSIYVAASLAYRRTRVSSDRLGRADHVVDGAHQRLFQGLFDVEDIGDHSSVGRDCSDGGSVGGRLFADVYILARVVRGADCTRAHQSAVMFHVQRNA